MEIKQTTFDRLCLLREWLKNKYPKITEAAIERKLGLSTSYFKTRLNAPITKGGKGLREQTIRNIENAWNTQYPPTPSININWLASGIGDMLGETYSDMQSTGIPYFNEDFSQATWLPYFHKLTPSSYMSLPPYNQKSTVCINASGNSMAPTIISGDKVVMQAIESNKKIVYGEIYALVMMDGTRTIRRIIRATDKENIRLLPDNKEGGYGDFQDVQPCDIKMLFKVLCVIRTF